MKISAIKGIQNEVLIRSDKGNGCATCGFFLNTNYKARYQKLLEFYHTGENEFESYEPLTYLYFSKYFYMLSKKEQDQITYYRLFMLEIFKDVVKNETI